MKVNVKLFARCRELAGKAEADLQIRPGTTPTILRSQIEDYFPQLRDCVPSLLIAVNGEFANSNLVLKEGDEIALLPPLGGG